MSSPPRREPVLISAEFVLRRDPQRRVESRCYYCYRCKEPFNHTESLEEMEEDVKCPSCNDTFVEKMAEREQHGVSDPIQPETDAVHSSTHPRDDTSSGPSRHQSAIHTPVITDMTSPQDTPSQPKRDRHDLPIEEDSLLEPQEESMPSREVPSEAVMDTTSHVSSVEDDVTASQEEMVMGVNFSSPSSPPREESTSSQEPTSESGSYRASSRDRQRERRQALMREREELWARRHDRLMDPFDDDMFESSFRRRRARFGEDPSERSRRPHMVIRMTRGQDGVAQTSLSIFAGPPGPSSRNRSASQSERHSPDREEEQEEDPGSREGEEEPSQDENPQARPQRNDGFINLVQAILGAFGDNPDQGRDEGEHQPSLAQNLPFFPPMLGLLSRPQHLAGNPRDYAWGPRGMDDIISWLHNQMGDGGPPPADRSKVAKLPRQPIGMEEADKECSICQELFTIGIEALFIPCGHFFHVGCILPWFDLHDTCPTCRYSINTGTLPSGATMPATSGPSTRDVPMTSGPGTENVTTASGPSIQSEYGAPSTPGHSRNTPEQEEDKHTPSSTD